MTMNKNYGENIMFTKVLHIGINYKGTEYELSGCLNDVDNLNQYLRNNFDYSKTQVKIINDNTTDKPTRQNILNACKWLLTDVNSDSKLFIHYSGHGSHIRDRSGDEIDHQDEVICPIDNTFITDDELKKILVNPLPKGASLWALFDCCHSGTVLDLRFRYNINLRPRGPEYNILSDNHYKPTKGKVVLFSGCKDNQTSADAWEVGEFQGAMTYSFLKTLKTLKAHGKPLSYKNLMKYLLVFIKSRGYSQIPRISSGQFLNLNEKMW